MTTVPASLDHLVLATTDLATAVADFTARTGVIPARGGSHTGRGTANVLVGLGGAAYLEIIGPDPEQPDPATPRPFGIDALVATRLVTWAVRPDDLDATVARARSAGYDPGEPAAMSRRTPAGDELRWRLTPDAGVVPFLIDWGTSTHPSASGLPAVRLESLTLADPDPEPVRRHLAALGLAVDVERSGHPSLTATLVTPRGRITL